MLVMLQDKVDEEEDAGDERQRDPRDSTAREDTDFPEEGVEEGEDMKDAGEQEGFTKPELPEEELELPDNMLLDGGAEGGHMA